MPSFEAESSWTPEEVWTQIDRAYLKSKLSDIQKVIRRRADEEKGVARAIARETGVWTNYPIERFSRERKLIEETAEMECRAAEETWEMQGYALCPAFYLAVERYVLSPLFSARTMGVISDLTLENGRTGNRLKNLQAFCDSFAGEMTDLKHEWHKKMLRAGREREYAAKAKRNSLQQPVVATADPKLERKSTPRRRRLSAKERGRRDEIVSAIQMGLKGIEYCRELDRRRLLPPQKWRDAGCPMTYAGAYKSPKWRKHLQQEKWWYGKR